MYLRQENVKETFFVVPEDTYYCRLLLKKIAEEGAEKARISAAKTLDEVQKIIGFTKM